MHNNATAIYLLAALYHESTRRPVNDGKTLAHATGNARPFVEWEDLTNDQRDGRRRTARSILCRYSVGEPFPDLGTDPVGTEDLAAAIHECERDAVQRGEVVVNLHRPWVTYDDLPDLAKEGRRMQAAFLKARAFFLPVMELR